MFTLAFENKPSFVSTVSSFAVGTLQHLVLKLSQLVDELIDYSAIGSFGMLTLLELQLNNRWKENSSSL